MKPKVSASGGPAPKPEPEKQEGKQKKSRDDYKKQEEEKLSGLVKAQEEKDAAGEKTQPMQCTIPRCRLADIRQDGLKVAEEGKWIKIIAVHLSAVPAFAQWMKNPQELESILLTKDWLGAVFLPGRSVKYNDLATWHKSWFGGADRRMKILRLAREMYERRVPTVQTTIANTVVEKPDNSPEAQKKRSGLFKVHSTRQKLVNLIKTCTDTEFALVTYSKPFASPADATTADERVLAVWNELQELEGCKEDCRRKLQDTMLNKVGYAVLDNLLDLDDVQADKAHGKLYDLPSVEGFEVSTSASENESQPAASQDPEEEEDDESSSEAEITELEGVKICFLLDRTLGVSDPKVFTLRTPVDKNWKELQEGGVTGDAIVDGAELRVLDSECAKWMKELGGKVNRSSFVLTFQEFEKVISRPEVCANAKKYANMWINPRCWLVAMKDNIAHVRRIVHAMLANDLIIKHGDEYPYDDLQKILRRMWALLALSFGNWPEPALLCTIMDSLLEDLAALVVGHLDPAFETTRMRAMLDGLNDLSEQGKTSVQSQQPALGAQQKEHDARQLFAELARFYRGAVMMGVAACSPKIGDKNKDTQKLWYESLLKWNAHCGHRTCQEQLEVTARTEAKTQKYSLSVAVSDERVGYPEERSFISSNRRMAYSCFYHFLVAVRYHAGLGPFFHYFAHLWHPACRPFRGKQDLIDDINLMEQRIQESQSQSESQ
ncbi:hypothetical protein D0869_02757 [Hortaea werneckii]|uniref:Uncharacterized protein n=1 Tax=Hortaea werneckii TaxID=91943 RepID=A0A3M6X8N5_HORWE|nr:hypothetical protein D0869_02757 [Hortaea werneckii]RMY01754.1 hypothetical protein D0868_08329 [Hortaea werneckii]RMY26190.1 hypothetical protein D0867_00216 [Hortaea werneckii]RMY41718.1 hypothetical protein D0866_00409 [Hortaea werneckii]